MNQSYLVTQEIEGKTFSVHSRKHYIYQSIEPLPIYIKNVKKLRQPQSKILC